MFDVCFDCDTQLTEQKGTVYGYWGDTKIEFTALPRYSCSTCNTFYLDEKIAILTQEITRALTDINLAVLAKPKRPKADGIACPRIAGYNNHNTGKERTSLFRCATEATAAPRDVPNKSWLL